jgi:hypothetical protein
MKTDMNNQVAQQTADRAAAGVEQIEAFLADLARQGKSPHTVRSYRADLLAFQRSFDGANHEGFAASLINTAAICRPSGAWRLPVNRQAGVSGPQMPAWEPR